MCGLAIAFVAAFVLFAVWYDVSAELKSEWTLSSLIRARRHFGGAVGVSNIFVWVGIGVLMVISGIGLCFDLSSDGPPKKKSWEDER